VGIPVTYFTLGKSSKLNSIYPCPRGCQSLLIKRGCINYQLKAAYIVITNVLWTPVHMCSINFEHEVEWRVAAQGQGCLHVSYSHKNKKRYPKEHVTYGWIRYLIIIMNIISTEFARAGWCSPCVKGKRSVQCCWLIKEHDDEKSGFCDTM